MNELNFIRCEVFGEVYWLLHVLEHLFLTSSFKGGFTFDHLEQEDAESPYINFVIVGLPEDHFRRHIL